MSESSDAATSFRAVLVMRQSPDWRRLSRDFRSGDAIDPARFLPAASTLGFPENLLDLIALWNQCFAVDYFDCRARLRDIAERNLERIAGVRRFAAAEFQSGAADFVRDIVFFHDDDDWFAPELGLVISRIVPGEFDVCVFPLVRLWTDTVTFARRGARAPALVGRLLEFGFRYHSNNYGVAARLLDEKTYRGMIEHMPASEYASARGFRDLYINRTLSVTSKTPCSASMLHELGRRRDDPRAWLRRYVDAVTALVVPEEIAWLRSGLNEIARLFASIAES